MNKAHGSGKMTFPGGDQYIGDYRHGKRHGNGTFRYASGNICAFRFSKSISWINIMGKRLLRSGGWPYCYAWQRPGRRAPIWNRVWGGHSSGPPGAQEVETVVRVAAHLPLANSPAPRPRSGAMAHSSSGARGHSPRRRRPGTPHGVSGSHRCH